MKPLRRSASSPRSAARETAELRLRLAEANDTLRAIRRREVDSLVVAGARGAQRFMLQGAEHTYRALIETMSEGVVTLTADAMVLYANRCFAHMVRHPLEQVIGSSFDRFLSAADQVAVRRVVRRMAKSAAKMQVMLIAGEGPPTPVQLSLCPLPGSDRDHATIGMVLTDMTEARRTEALLRALTKRVVEVQEAERGSIALELHDEITQLLCAILFRSEALAISLSARDGPARVEATKLRDMLGNIGEEVERISRNLRPGVLEQLGLAAVIEQGGREFTDRTGVPFTLTCGDLKGLLPAAAELALYRIFQEAMRNVEQHSHAHRVSVQLTKKRDGVQLSVRDNGAGFVPSNHVVMGTSSSGLGLLTMRERAAYVGGTLEIKSTRKAGTEVVARIPMAPAALRST